MMESCQDHMTVSHCCVFVYLENINIPIFRNCKYASPTKNHRSVCRCLQHLINSTQETELLSCVSLLLAVTLNTLL